MSSSELSEDQFCARVLELLAQVGLLGKSDGNLQLNSVDPECDLGDAENCGRSHFDNEGSVVGNGVSNCSSLDDAQPACVDNGVDVPRLLTFKQPQQLEQLLDISLSDSGTGCRRLGSICQSIVAFSVRTNDFRFRNQLFGGMDPFGLAASLIVECLNTSQYTYEVAPVFSLCERRIMSELSQKLGWLDEEGEGLCTPGASLANMYAICVSRFRLHPDVKQTGLAHLSQQLVVFVSEEAHYSSLKAANWLGFGTDNVVFVGCDSLGRMDPNKLRQQVASTISSGRLPLIVVATAGTTVLGAFDPLSEISLVCRQHNIWLHVDAAWGGAVLFSRQHRHLLDGVEQADSFCWNPHKMLGVPLQCSVLLVKQRGLLLQCNSAHASYLFQPDKPYCSAYDTGDMSVQCGRKVDAFKLWLVWKARGSLQMGELVDRAFSAAKCFAQATASHPGFRLVLGPGVTQCTNVCFWYIPPSMRAQNETEQWWSLLGRVAPLIKRRMMTAGSLMIGFQPLPHRKLPNFFRLVFTCHPPPTEANVQYIIKEVDRLGSTVSLDDLE